MHTSRILTEEESYGTSLQSQKLSDFVKLLKSLRSNNLNKLVFDHLNINSIRNKFEFLVELFKGNIDVLTISENKINDSFPIGNFVIDGYRTPSRLDINTDGNGI